MVVLSEELTHEHREIDAGIEAFVAGLGNGEVNPEPLTKAFADLRRHIWLEEEFLFPPLRQAGLMMPVMVMLREHGELWQAMAAIDELVAAGSTDHEQVRGHCTTILSQLNEHNTKEEPIIYPHAETDLSEDAAAELIDFWKTGELPPGWVCQQAG